MSLSRSIWIIRRRLVEKSESEIHLRILGDISRSSGWGGLPIGFPDYLVFETEICPMVIPP